MKRGCVQMSLKWLLLLGFGTFFSPSVSFAGGYVDGSETLTASADTTGAVFDNELFTDTTLVSQVNNDLIVTPSTADPISTVTGNMYHDETDITIKGRGLNIAFTRTYNSGYVALAGTGKPLSPGWAHSYNMQLVANDFGQFPNYPAAQAPENTNGFTSSITYRNERGGESNYLVNDLSSYQVTSPKGVFDTLELDTPVAGQHTLTFRNGTKYIFDSGNNMRTPGQVAKLIQIADPYGNELNFTYDGSNRLSNVTDNLGISGRTGLAFTYDASDRITKVEDWTSRSWDYGYDANGQLVTVTNPLSQTTTYVYAANDNYLTSIVKPADRGGQQVTTTFSYYENAKAFNNKNSFGDGETVDYDLYRKYTRITDPGGFIRTHSYDKNGALLRLAEPDGGLMRFLNNEEGLRYQKTDALGFVTQYSYRADKSIGSLPSDNFGRVSKEIDPLGNATEIDYGIYDQPTVTVDKRGTVFTNTYYATDNIPAGEKAGKLQRQQVVLGGSTVTLAEFTYTAGGNIKTKTDFIDAADPAKKRVTTITYDADDYNPTQIVVTGQPGGESITTNFTYDSLGRQLTQTLQRKTSATDPTPISITTTFEYDALDRVVATTDALGNIRRMVFDENGKVTSESIDYFNGGGYTTRLIRSLTYDAADRLATETDIDGNVTQFAYDARGNLIQVTDANNHISKFEYDSMNRRTAVIDANGARTETLYDLGGRVVQTIDANGNATSFEYDDLGRQTKITTALNLETVLTYDANGNVLTITDPENRVTTNVYDTLNRLTQSTDADNGVTAFTYDLLGNRTSLTDAENSITTFEYDGLQRLVEVVDPLIQSPTDQTTVMTVDEAGNVLTQTDRNGETTRFTYDLANRLVKAEFLADSTEENLTYDIFTDLVQVQNSDVTYDYTYDTQHRLTGKTDTRAGSVVKSLSWTYDGVDNIITKTGYDGFVTTFQYNAANRLTSMSNPDHLQVSYFYDAAGRLVNRILSNDVKSFYQYDADNRLTLLLNEGVQGVEVGRRVFTYDGAGNIINIGIGPQGAEQNTVYTYDVINRLTNVDAPGTANDEAYTYDKVGNRLTSTEGGSTFAYVTNANNQLLEVRQGNVAGPILYSYTYDANGNRVQKLDGAAAVLQSYVYDQKNRIENLTTGADTLAFQYDPSNYRTKLLVTGAAPQTRNYYLEAEHLEAITDENNIFTDRYFRGVVVDEIVHGYHVDSNSMETASTFHHDHLRSVTSTVDRLGAELSTSTFGPFGGLLSETGDKNGNRQRYTGRELDEESGLYYYRARYYDTEVGRFITEDPIGFRGGVNKYAYVNNNPINANDPSGFILEKIFNDPEELAGHKNQAVPFQEFVKSTEGLTLDQVMRQAGSKEINAKDSTAGGPSVRYVIDPQNPNQVIDMRHFLVIGQKGETFGLGVEIVQGLNDLLSKISDSFSPNPSAFDSQDFLSNQLGSEFFKGSENNNSVPNFSKNLSDFFSGRVPSPEASIGGQHINGATTSGASGGFVIYPNKPNTNMMQRVYSK